MKIKEVIDALEKFAPLPLQDGYDNSGLQIGLTEVEVTGALLCLDVTEAVIEEAKRMGYNLIVSHHPLIFKGYKSITGKDYIERCILDAIKNDIVIYSMHTNLDNVNGGVSFKMAEKIGLKNIKILDPKENALLKLVTFVPKSHADIVRNTLFAVGCGHIGNYDNCSYNLEGMGTFRALDGTSPFCGEKGEFHKENEIRIETILYSYNKNAILKTLLEVHPYEEPAYDFYSLDNKCNTVGAGVIGELEEPQTELEFIKRIKKIFEVGCIKHNRLTGRLIQKVALCGGSGAFLLPCAVGKSDVFITGEVKYHDYFNYEDKILIADIGHYESEQYTKELIYSIIKEVFPSLEIMISKINTNPIKYL